MIKESTFTMPKTALILCYIFCGNFILSGYTAEQCPKNPLAPTSSVSGIVVGAIVGVEKLVNGVASYIYFLVENSVNQVIGISSNVEGYLSNLTIRIQDFASGLLGGISGQLKTIYNASSGSIRIIFDSVINMENSVQSFTYKQVESISESIMNGKITGGITTLIKHPFSSISKGLGKAKNSVSKLSSKISGGVEKVVTSVKTSGVPSDIKDILMSPVKGVQTFTKESQSAINTVKNETSARFSGYLSDFKNGGIIDKIVAISSVPFGASMEVWSFTLKISEAAMKSVSASTKDVVQPFLGQVLTERLGKIVMLPMDLTEGFYKSTVNLFSQIGGVISEVTGGGSVSEQINMVVKHPITVVENALNSTTEGIKGLSKAFIGAELTEKLAGIVGSPGKALSGAVSSIMNGQFSQSLLSLLTTPLTYLEKAWSKMKELSKSITTGIIGEKWTSRISGILSAPGKTLSDFISSITGGGSISVQIKSTFGHPIETFKNVWATVKTTATKIMTSITGGGSLGTQISTVLKSPITIVQNLWSSVKKGMKDVSKLLFGGFGSEMIENMLSAPLSSISEMISSITGGGSLSTQIKNVIGSPFVVLQSLWQKTKSFTESFTKTILGGSFTESLKKLITSPLSAVSGVYNSISSTLASFSASISISGGGITNALKSFVAAPIEVVKGTFNGLQKAEQSLMSSIKSLLKSLPLVGSSASVNVAVGSGDQKGGTEAEVKAGGSVGARRRRRVRRSPACN